MSDDADEGGADGSRPFSLTSRSSDLELGWLPGGTMRFYEGGAMAIGGEGLIDGTGFTHREGEPHLAHVYFSHFERMKAVIDAARNGDYRVLAAALEKHDRLGWRDEEPNADATGPKQ